MRCILFLATAVAVSACSPSVKQEPPIPQKIIPEGLKDCSFYQLISSAGTRYNVVRCPSSSTSVTRPGKSPENTSTIDGPSPDEIAQAQKKLDVASMELKRREIEARIAQAEAAIAANKAELEKMK